MGSNVVDSPMTEDEIKNWRYREDITVNNRKYLEKYPASHLAVDAIKQTLGDTLRTDQDKNSYTAKSRGGDIKIRGSVRYCIAERCFVDRPLVMKPHVDVIRMSAVTISDSVSRPIFIDVYIYSDPLKYTYIIKKLCIRKSISSPVKYLSFDLGSPSEILIEEDNNISYYRTLMYTGTNRLNIPRNILNLLSVRKDEIKTVLSEEFGVDSYCPVQFKGYCSKDNSYSVQIVDIRSGSLLDLQIIKGTNKVKVELEDWCNISSLQEKYTRYRYITKE